jgi:hypothetical protein
MLYTYFLSSITGFLFLWPVPTPVFLQATGAEWATFLEIIRIAGLPFALALFALITGARGLWYFGSTVKQLTAQYEQRLSDAKEEIAWLKTINSTNMTTVAGLIDQLRKIAEAQERAERRAGREQRRDA